MERMTFTRTPEGRLNLNSGEKLQFAARHGEELRRKDAGPASLVNLAAKDLTNAAQRLSFTTGRDFGACVKHLLKYDDLSEWYGLSRLHPQPDDKFSSLVTFEAH